MHREIASCAGSPSIQNVAEALDVLACRPNGEDNCTAAWQPYFEALFTLLQYVKVLLE